MSGIFDSDFVLIGLLNGHVYTEFNNIGSLRFQSINGTSQQLYNDGEIHQLNFTFNTGQLELLVDNSPVSLQGKTCARHRYC